MNGSRIAGAILFCAVALGQKNASYSIIEGAVFRDPGLALADAKVVLQAKDNPKAKKQQITTNFRGEFEFRVPAVEAVYVVKATMKGFRADQKEAQVVGGGVPGSERVEVNLVLAPETK